MSDISKGRHYKKRPPKRAVKISASASHARRLRRRAKAEQIIDESLEILASYEQCQATVETEGVQS